MLNEVLVFSKMFHKRAWNNINFPWGMMGGIDIEKNNNILSEFAGKRNKIDGITHIIEVSV